MERLDDLSTWRMFCEIVRSEGLNAACERLNCEPSKVSRALKSLEDRLGSPLFSRNGRRIQLTEFGRVAYEKVLPILALHGEMLQELKGDKNNLSGLIRVASHAGIGPAEITPALVEFQQIYPDIQFELTELSSPIPHGFVTVDGHLNDVIIGYGNDDPIEGVIKRYSGEMPFVACASPLYIKRHGLARTPEECQKHTGILINSPTRTATTTLSNGKRTAELVWKNSLTVHSLNSAKTALMLGAGIVPDLPLFHCMREIEEKTIVPVLEGWHRKSASCFVFVREEAYQKRRVQVFVDWIAAREHNFLQALTQRFPSFF